MSDLDPEAQRRNDGGGKDGARRRGSLGVRVPIGRWSYAQAKNPLLNVQMVDVLDSIDKYRAAHPDDPMVQAAVAFVASH